MKFNSDAAHWKEETRVCPGCLERGRQPLSNFYRHRARPNGRMWECKVCTNKRTVTWRKKNKKPRVMPAHGTQTRYRRGCRCEPCGTAERNYRKLRTVFSRKPFVKSNFAQGHLRQFSSSYQAAKKTGVSEGTIMRIQDGGRIREQTERRILAA